MVVNKSKKVNKYRGHTTHGGGHRKKRRGAGSRGGRGNAGRGKRAGHKKAGTSFKLGKHGFKSKNGRQVKAINLGYFTEAKVNKLLAAGKISKEGNTCVVDLSKLGYDKLLGAGNVNLKLRVTVKFFTSSAEEKIKAAGGEIISKPVSNPASGPVEESVEKSVEKSTET